MKQCPNCQANISDTAKFCVKCGFNIKKYKESQRTDESIFCPECGTKFSGGAFCPECGARADEELSLSETGLSVSVPDTFGDSWLDGIAENVNAEVENKEKQKDKSRMENALSAFEYEEHADGTYTLSTLKDTNILRVVIPEGVATIGDGVFEGRDIVSVSLPESLVKIGNRAFADCRFITNLDLPQNVLIIGDEAFAGCNLLDIELSATVRSVGKDALKGTVRQVAEENTESVGIVGKEQKCVEFTINEKGCLRKYNGNNTDVVVPQGVKSIGINAFYNCNNIKSIILPEGLISIGAYAFRGCTNLTSINIPKSVTKIADGAFLDCPKKIIRKVFPGRKNI